MKGKILISIVIVNYNTEKYLEECLRSIFQYIKSFPVEVIVVDNASKDFDSIKLKELFPDVKIIISEENKGFGNGCNQGIKFASGNFIAFVNPDTLFNEDVFSELISLMEQNSEIGVCSGILQDMDGKLIYTFNKFPDISWELTEAIGRGSNYKISKLLENPKIKNKENVPIFVDWLIGAFMLFRAEIIKELKGFDEDFFLYYEDVEIQRRVYKLGYKIAVLPSVRISHIQRASVKSFDGENLYYFHLMKSKFIYFYKYMGVAYVFLLKIMHASGILFRIISLPFRIEFRGKKRQKLFQYRFMLRIIFCSYDKLRKYNIEEAGEIKNVKNSELIKDKFWN